MENMLLYTTESVGRLVERVELTQLWIYVHIIHDINYIKLIVE